MNGILNLDKQEGISSHDCLYKLRRIFGNCEVVGSSARFVVLRAVRR